MNLTPEDYTAGVTVLLIVGASAPWKRGRPWAGRPATDATTCPPTGQPDEQTASPTTATSAQPVCATAAAALHARPTSTTPTDATDTSEKTCAPSAPGTTTARAPAKAQPHDQRFVSDASPSAIQA